MMGIALRLYFSCAFLLCQGAAMLKARQWRWGMGRDDGGKGGRNAEALSGGGSALAVLKLTPGVTLLSRLAPLRCCGALRMRWRAGRPQP